MADSLFRVAVDQKGELMEGFRAMLQSDGLIIFDGAMGTELVRRGVQSVPNANLLNPGAVVEIHNEYFAAGSNVAITNTLTMNRISIESHKQGIDVEAINVSGAKLARTAAEGKGNVLGNLSSTGQMLEPYGTYSEADFIGAFKEQASYLQRGGVDGFIIETVFDLREAVCALRGCKAVSSLPIIVSMTFNTEQNEGRTIMGDSARDCATRLTEEGADALGTNCGNIDPSQMADIVTILAASTKLPIVAEPNAGKPRLIDGITRFDMDPVAFAVGTSKCRLAGARMLGGCCGTTPEHIRALREQLIKNH
jgi:5-methyltetrahydrofolate--homocysteine methyltransferase